MNDESYKIGRQVEQVDVADGVRVAGLAALLDHANPPWNPAVLPPLGHWLCFQPQVRQSLIGPDGHPARSDDGLLPTVDLPRRMWAGSRITFLSDIALGATIRRTSTLVAASPKDGRSGKMLVVTVRHEIAPEGQATAIVEEQDIVYREAAPPVAEFKRVAADAGEQEAIARIVSADPVQLFRYSALTFNGHRIHYDRDYAREVEGYPGLVVQGPLMATLLLDHLLRERPQARIEAYSFRAMSPTFDGEPVRLGLVEDGEEVLLRALTPAGVAMSATARIRA